MTLQWGKRIFAILSGQSLIQLLQLLTGILIINSLSVEQYAVYTIAGTLIALGSLVTNSGVLYALAVFVARATNAQEIAAYVGEAIYLRSRLLVVSVVIIVFVALLLEAVFQSWKELSLCVMVVVIMVYFTAKVEMRRSVLLAAQKVRVAIVADLASGLTRTLLIVSYLLSGGSSVIVILSLTLVGILVACRVLPEPEAKEGNKLLRQEYFRFMGPLLPEYIYVLLQGHTVNFILGINGATRQLGELGALGRLGQIVGTVAVLNQTLIQPYVSRFTSRADFRKRVAIVVSLAVIGCIFVVMLGLLIPSWLVWILGSQYQHLGYMVPWMMLVVAIQQLSGVIYSLCVASGRPFGLIFTVPVGLVVQTAYIVMVGVKDIETALGLAFVGAMSDLAIRLATVLHLCRHIELSSDGTLMR